jgi:hypothetical protein
MKKFSCHKCQKEFNQKAHLENHLNKKNPCDEVEIKKLNFKDDDDKNKNINIIDAKKLKEYLDECKCGYCGKEFTRKSSALHHINNNCKKVKEIEEDRQNIFLELKKKEEEDQKLKILEEENQKLKNMLNIKEKELEKKDKDKDLELKFQQKILELEKSINDLKKSKNTSSKILNSHNTDNSIKNHIHDNNFNQQNIILNNYTADGMPNIPQNELLPLFKRGFQTPVELTKHFHFNPKYPEFHNIYIPRINEKHGMMYKENGWGLIDKNQLVDDLYENKRDYVIQNKETFYEKLNEHEKKRLNRWLNTDDDNDEAIINIKNDLKKLLYDKRHMAMEKKKELDKLKKQKKIFYIQKREREREKANDSDNDSDNISNYSYDKNNDSD